MHITSSLFIFSYCYQILNISHSGGLNDGGGDYYDSDIGYNDMTTFAKNTATATAAGVGK